MMNSGIPKWHWNSDRRAKAIIIVARGVMRTSSIPAINPIVITEEPLSRTHPWFQISIIRLGTDIAIGVAESNVVIDKGDTLGSQKGIFNCAYVRSVTTTAQLIANGKAHSKSPPDMQSGDVIDVKVDFSGNCVHFWKNQQYITSISASGSALSTSDRYVHPAVSLSADSEILISSVYDQPDYVALLQSASAPSKVVATAQTSSSTTWEWSESYKAAAIIISGRTVSRSKSVGNTKNPIVLTTRALSRASPWFRLNIKKMGPWVAFGICEPSIKLSGGDVLGDQSPRFNLGYLDQTGKKDIQRVRINKADVQLNFQKLSAGDIMDIRLNFDDKTVHFWRNEMYLGKAPCNSYSMFQENMLYPCVQLANDTEVEIISGTMPNFNY